MAPRRGRRDRPRPPRAEAARRGHRYEAYLAFDEHLHAIVVAKLIRPHLVHDEHTLAGLRAEAEMLDRLDHPVIVRAFDAVLEGPRPQLVLEHLEGPRLSTLVRRYGRLPPEQLSRSRCSSARRFTTSPPRASSTSTSSPRTRS